MDYNRLYEQVCELTAKTPRNFAEWTKLRPYNVYRDLPKLLGVSNQTISRISKGKQRLNAEMVKSMAIISFTPATIIVNDLNLLELSLNDVEHLKQFDAEHQDKFHKKNPEGTSSRVK
ncbi:MAG: helix-turn-helix transcriptional regulator [Bacteroidales bacterium]|nr:helix-turn-helix transcriptional regulator [Bacteroidales bacterium]